MRKVPPIGPSDARVMVVGEAPGAEEELRGEPFVGVSGQEMTRMLHDAGIIRSECFITNVSKYRPPNNDIGLFFLDSKLTLPGPEIQQGIEELKNEILRVKPNLIIALGDTALWALTGRRGITSWRGSVLPCSLFSNVDGFGKVLSTYHPAAILRMWEWRWVAVQDLRRAKKEMAFPEIRIPSYNFIVRPSYDRVIGTLQLLLAKAESEGLKIAVDLETRSGHIACCGLAWSRLDAICIPFMCTEDESGYWPLEEEVNIILQLRELLKHPRVKIVGQNFLYDCQYLHGDWMFIPDVHMDTMIAHHTCFAGLPKALSFISSLYCEFYQFWKEEGKLWEPSIPEERLWIYNCKDAVNTFECSDVLEGIIDRLNLRAPYEMQMSLFRPVLDMMLRGVKIDQEYRSSLFMEMSGLVAERQEYINYVVGRELNIRSPKQMKEFFYYECNLSPIKNRKTGTVTCNDEALEKIFQREPILRPLVETIRESRTLGVDLSNVVQAPIDPDGRMRCSYNIAGTVSFRFSSSESAFGTGTNLQNIANLARRKKPASGLNFPNLRRLFTPDDGYLLVDADLERADLQVVVWESDDADLNQKLREGVDIHTENAKDLFGVQQVTKAQREFTKVWVHGTNYGGMPRTMAIHSDVTVHQAERMYNRWFQIHPGIKEWHERVLRQLMMSRCVHNKFGYRRFYFERIEAVLPEALAWIASSTVSVVINKGLVSIHNNLPQVELLLQTHDSLTFQYPKSFTLSFLNTIRPHLLITVPYDDPLIIPITFKISDKSWGDVEEVPHSQVRLGSLNEPIYSPVY